MFVSLQCQVSVLLTDKTNKSLSIPPPLSIKAQRSPSSTQHNIRSIRQDVNLKSTACFSVHNVVWEIWTATTYFAMLSPLKNRAMSWSEDCHGSPLALITVLSHTFSILLLHTHKHKHTDISSAGGDLEWIWEAENKKIIYLEQTLLTKCQSQTSHWLSPGWEMCDL